MGDERGRAGEAFAAAIRDDSDAQAALARARLRLAAFGAGVDQVAAARATAVAHIDQCLSLLREARDAGDADRSEEMEALARELKANRTEWEATHGEAYPCELDGWIRQATRAGVDPNAVHDSTPADLLPMIEGHLLRLRDQAQTKPSSMLVQALLIAKMQRSDPFTSFRALVKELRQQLPGVSLSMVRTAFDKSPVLKTWKDAGLAARQRNRKGRDVRLNRVHEDSAGDDGDGAIWARLLAEATPDERARLNAMSDDGRAELIRLERGQLAEDRADRRKARRRD